MDRVRVDLVKKAILSNCTGDFEWVDEKTTLRVSQDPRNKGFLASHIKLLTKEWVSKGGEIKFTAEKRPNWKDKRDYYYWVVIKEIDEFPSGLFVELELTDDDQQDPLVTILNAHPPSFP